MRAYRLQDFGGPNSIMREDLPSPTPGPGESLLRIRATSLNFRDLLISKGIYNPRLRLPLVPLSDGAGEVVANGPGSTRFQPGDRVCASFMTGWIAGPLDDASARTALGGEVSGMLADEVVVPSESLVEVPDHLTFEEAATLPCAGVTAWHALFGSQQVRPGETVLVQGTGGVSLFALQFARLAGARVIVTSSRDEKLERAIRLGAAEGINYRTTPGWDDRVLELTDRIGVDHVVEVGGAGTLPKSLRCVRRSGHVALIGILTGSGEVNPLPILMKSIRLQGIFVGPRVMFEAMNRAMTQSKLRPVVDRVFDFEDAIAALHHLESGAHFGKVVIRA